MGEAEKDAVLVALGPGWESRNGGGWMWLSEESIVNITPSGPSTRPWRVFWYDSDEGSIERFTETPEAAVAVAHLLVAAERVAGGAEVGARPPRDSFAFYAKAGSGTQPGSVVIDATVVVDTPWRPSHARAFALDLLRAADEAEAQS